MDNHSCEPNARDVIHRLSGTEVDGVLIESIVSISAGSEVLLDCGWSVLDPNKLVICECGSDNCNLQLSEPHSHITSLLSLKGYIHL